MVTVANTVFSFGKQKSLSRLRREIAILQGFYQRQPVYLLAGDLNVDIKTVTR